MQFLANPLRNPVNDRYQLYDEPLAVHRMLPGYTPTALIDAPELARQLGIGRVSIKDESARLGLPSFKILGASYAIYRTLAAQLGVHTPWRSLDEWRTALEPLRPFTLTAATDGNHGRAVAYMARLLGATARIFVPHGTAQARIDAIATEGAEVVQTTGSYDEAVARAASHANEHCFVISDTAWEGYEDVPTWVIEGYSTMLNEIDAAFEQQHSAPPDLVAVQIGVGALACAVVQHYRQPERAPHTTIIGVEPARAACVFDSLVAGHSVTLPGVQDSVMAGLNCGTPSPIAWPIIAAGLDACITIEDEWAYQAMRVLAQAGVVAGESGAAGLAGMLALFNTSHTRPLFVTPETHLLVISTEGATDPQAYEQVIKGFL